MRTLITGGAGFIGANLAHRLSEQGHDIVVLDDLSAGDATNLAGLDVDLVEGSVLDADVLGALVPMADAVVHLAARSSVPESLRAPAEVHEVNVTGTIHVLEAVRAAGGRHVVVTSSAAVYGADRDLPTREDAGTDPRSPYAVSKLAAEQYALCYQTCYGIPVLALRPFNVYGPRQPPAHTYAAVIPAFVDAVVRGRPIPLEGDGLQTRDFVYVGTVVDVLVDALSRRVTASGPVNLASGTRVSLRDAIGVLSTVVGRQLDIEYRPPREVDILHSQADVTRLTAAFPSLQQVDLVEGLRRTVGWHQSRTT